MKIERVKKGPEIIKFSQLLCGDFFYVDDPRLVCIFVGMLSQTNGRDEYTIIEISNEGNTECDRWDSCENLDVTLLSAKIVIEE